MDPLGNNPCPIQRVSSRSNATTGHALITGRQRQWTRPLDLDVRQDKDLLFLVLSSIGNFFSNDGLSCLSSCFENIGNLVDST